MGEAIPDRVIVAILRPFVRATRPVLDGLRESDPFGLRTRAAHHADVPAEERGLRDKVLDALAAVEVPGTARWASMDVSTRTRWWVRRVGPVPPPLPAPPRGGGGLGRK